MWRSSKFSPKKNSQFLCLITWDCPCSLGIPKINQLETAVNHSNCSACLPDRENRETKILFYSYSWPEQKQSSPVPNTRPRRSGLPQIKEANCLDKTVDNFLVLIVKLHYIFSQIFVDVCVGAKGITRVFRGCHCGVKKASPRLKWLSGHHDCLPEIVSPE